MAVRTDVIVRWEFSPRVILVLAPSQEITIQDLVDTCRVLEQDLDTGLQYDSLINAAGKEDLGNGIQVGITAELNNAVLGFEGRFDATSKGFVTTANATGEMLIDSSATFITDGLMAGDVVVNHTDGSTATVFRVDSETMLLTSELKGGSDNEFGLNDDYGVHQFARCSISGGNLVAVDEAGDAREAVFTTPYVFVDRAASTSAALVNADNIAKDVPLWREIVF